MPPSQDAPSLPPGDRKSLCVPSIAGPAARPPLIRHVSSPTQPWKSPLRHHRRTPSIGPRTIKETLNASLQYDDDEDGVQEMRINQYNIKQEIGRGSFGAVHVAVDQAGKQYAVKEFSKSRLRKRSQSHILRRPHAARRRGSGFLNSSSHKRSASDIHRDEEAGNPLYLIREEIAILKKLDHENVVQLIEVLDDPDGDSLYMVMEMCGKGVIMKVGLDDTAEPYPEEKCRLWFRDMILGIEYLHAQGIVHRDIKPDNLLLTDDDVLKIVDFGVSEIFEKKAPMLTAKSAGSPAFLPPELCYAGHGDISGTAADIWSMGVSLYCLLFGKLPFRHSGVLELYESIKHDELPIPDVVNPQLADLLKRLFEKDPAKRIKMPELREHPWVTRDGEDMLLPAEENTANLIANPTEEEMNSAITKSIRNVMFVVKAVQKLKRLTLKRFKGQSRSPSPMADSVSHHRAKSVELDNRNNLEQRLAISGVQREISMESVANAFADIPKTVEPDDAEMSDQAQDGQRRAGHQRYPSIEVQCVDPPMENGPTTEGSGEGPSKGQAVSPLNLEPRYLHIGVGGSDPSTPRGMGVVSESPMPTDENVYEEAYREEVARIRQEQGQSATVYLTKWVE